MSSVIAVLQDLGWKAPKPDLWLSPDGDTWAMDADWGLEAFLQDFKKTLRARMWAGVGHTHHARGATGGVDPTVAQNYLARLERIGRPAEAGMLRAILAGAIWGRHRKWEAGLSTSKLCPRCLLGEGTDLHKY